MASKGNSQLAVSLVDNWEFEKLKESLNLDVPEIKVGNKRAIRYATGIYVLWGPKSTDILSVYRQEYPEKELDKILSTFKFN